MTKRALLVAFVAAALAGTASASTGWTTHTSKSGGVSLQTPSAWLDITSKAPDVVKAMSSNPELKSLLAAFQSHDYFKLLCASPKGYPNVNVIAVPSGTYSLAVVAKLNKTQIDNLSYLVGSVSMKPVQLPAGRAYTLSYVEKPTGSPVATLQYIFVHKRNAYFVTYTSTPSHEKQDDPLFAKSIATFRFTG